MLYPHILDENIFSHMTDYVGQHFNYTTDEAYASALRPKLLATLDDPNQCRLLQLELTATIDAAGPFVKAIYDFVGAGH